MRESANTGRIRLSLRNHFSSVLEETREADTRKKAIQHKIFGSAKIVLVLLTWKIVQQGFCQQRNQLGSKIIKIPSWNVSGHTTSCEKH